VENVDFELTKEEIEVRRVAREFAEGPGAEVRMRRE